MKNAETGVGETVKQFKKTGRLFPGGKTKAFTLSYDDMVLQDGRFLEIINKYGLKCTFNLNTGMFGRRDILSRPVEAPHFHFREDEIKDIYKGHEVAVHTVSHPDLTALDDDRIFSEVVEDRKRLEELVGYPVRGMAYPGGKYDARVIEVLKKTGIVYSRTVNKTENFCLPHASDLYEWHPTCHHRSELLFDLARKFLGTAPSGANKAELQLFYVWGHTYEFDMVDNWDMIGRFCAMISGNRDVWYATNIEIADFINSRL